VWQTLKQEQTWEEPVHQICLSHGLCQTLLHNQAHSTGLQLSLASHSMLVAVPAIVHVSVEEVQPVGVGCLEHFVVAACPQMCSDLVSLALGLHDFSKGLESVGLEAMVDV
jgi:hypothetical protein